MFKTLLVERITNQPTQELVINLNFHTIPKIIIDDQYSEISNKLITTFMVDPENISFNGPYIEEIEEGL